METERQVSADPPTRVWIAPDLKCISIKSLTKGFQGSCPDSLECGDGTLECGTICQVD
jgi:hypothetical protein